MGKLGMLVQKVLNGDVQAYEKIFLNTKDNVFFHAKTLLKSDESAWDAVQDTYVAAFRGLEKLRTPDTAEVWLCAIAGNLCFNRIKRQTNTQKDDKWTLTPPELTAKDEAVRDYVAKALDALPVIQRIAILFRYCDDMSLAQIGSVIRGDEAAVRQCLAEAESNLGLVRDSAEDGRGITPARLKQALTDIRDDTVLPPAITLSIGLAVAQKCGYTSELRVTVGADKGAKSRASDTHGTGENDTTGKKAPRPTARERAAQGAKKGAMILASGLVVVGFVVGGFAVRAVVDARNADDGTPDNLNTFSTGHSNDDADAADGVQALSSESAQAYISIISDYTGRFGVSSSNQTGEGLAYAALIDFDGDGRQELYLYYIDSNFSADSIAFSVNEAGEPMRCLHEELWRYDGQLQCCFTQEHYIDGDLEDGTGAARWIAEADNGTTKLVSWYTYTDENGYIHQTAVNYALTEGVISESERTEGMFVVANEVKHRRDGYLVEEYYGTDNAHYDDVAYFVEGAVTNTDGRTAYTYEQSQAILDIATADVVPLNTEETDTPVVRLKENYDIRTQKMRLFAVEETDTGKYLDWAVSDVNAFLGMLADACVGN